MIYKIMVGLGGLLSSILIVENLIMETNAFVLLWTMKTGALTITSIVIGIMVGYGLFGMLHKNDSDIESEY